MTTFEPRAGGPSSVELFDEELSRHSVLHREHGDPAQVRRALQDVLDVVAAAATDAVGREVVEMAQQVVASLGAVLVAQKSPPPVSEHKSSWSLASLLGGDPRDERVPAPRARLEARVGQVVDAVRDTLETGERLRRAAVPPPPEVVVRPWAEDRELVRLLHDLFRAARRPDDFVKARIADQLVTELRLEHGIEVLDYDDTTAPCFTRIPADLETPRTIVPALLHDGVLLREGEVHVPASAAPPSAAPHVTTPTTGGVPR